MPYTIGPIQHPETPMTIPERRYATAGEVRFTNFTSCLGLIARHANGQVTAVHLSMFDQNDNAFDAAAATAAVNALGAYTEVLVIGHIGAWEENFGQIYHNMIGQLHDVSIRGMDDGICGGHVLNGRLQFYRDNQYRNVDD